MIRLSGSVKLRCAPGFGSPGACFGLRPRRWLGVPSALVPGSGLAASVARASASSSAFAARIRCSATIWMVLRVNQDDALTARLSDDGLC